MKSTLIVIAIALASGLLVASGAMAQFHRQIDVLALEYNDLDLRSASSEGKAEIEALGETGEITGTSHRQIDVLGPEYNDLDLRSAGSGEEAGTEEMVPAGSSQAVDIMGPDYRRGVFP